MRAALGYHAPPGGLAGPARLAATAAALALAVLTGCGESGGGRAPTAPLTLYVANAVDGTVTPLDGRTGLPLGAPLPAGLLPDQVVPVTGGVLVRSFSPRRSGALTHVTRRRGYGSAWTMRPVPLEGGARDLWLAGDGGRLAAVAYLAPDPTTGRLRGRLALVDAAAGAARPARDVWGAPARIAGLALDGGPDGPVAYLAVRAEAGQDPPAAPPRAETAAPAYWLLAVHAATGRLLAARHVAGAPAGLFLAPAPGRLGVRLYAVETAPGLDGASGAERGRVLDLDPATLAVEREHVLASRAVAVAVAPDGEESYALTADGFVLTRIDLLTGAQRPLAWLRESGTSLAVTDARVFVPNPFGDEVWVYERRSARPLPPIRVGRNPVAVALRGAA